MKILILTKRQTTNNDIIDHKFGRSWEFPYELAKLSNDVYGFCLSYKNKTEGPASFNKNKKDSNLSWCSINAGKIKPLGFLRYSIKAYNHAKKINPDIIFAMSDPIYAILGCWIARRLNKICLIDLQDNYDTYASFKIPFIPKLFKKSIEAAHGVICVSKILKDHMDSHYLKSINTFVIENGISNKKFHPINKKLCRKEFNLPLDAKIIGIGGSLLQNNGIKVVFEGFERLQKKYDNLHLVVTGTRNIEIPENDRIHDFGFLPYNRMKYFINALDTAIICNADPAFYTYAFPIKAFEIIACDVPLVISKIGPLMEYFEKYPECFFKTNNVDSFCKAIESQLSRQLIFNVKVNTWKNLSKDINSYLLKI